jgi:flagellar biosynthesis component FlhA
VKYKVLNTECRDSLNTIDLLIESDNERKVIRLDMDHENIIEQLKYSMANGAFYKQLDDTMCQELLEQVKEVVAEYVETRQQELLQMKKNFDLWPEWVGPT